jgi:divalent metal cation (Fe/Co/Zn/Cd) transporter
MPVLDGVASLIVGIILVVFALFLIYESKGLIVGESTDADVVSCIRQISQADPAVDKVESVLTMHFGPQNVLLNMNVSFRPELSGAKLPAVVQRLESAIRHEAPEIKRIFIETKSLTSQSANESRQRLP